MSALYYLCLPIFFKLKLNTMRLHTFLSLLLLLALPAILGAQQVDMDQLKGLTPRNIGPAGMSGRITAIDVDLSNPDIIYAGAASGGVWKSTSGGINWEPVFDDQPVQSIGAIAVTQSSPDIIWVGTGEGNPRNSQNSGAGIFRSLDGGRSWELMGLENTKTIHRIIVHRDNPNVVFAGAQGSAWGPNPERGVFKTTDGGQSWRKVLYIDDSTGLADLVVDPSNPNKLIAAMWTFGRKPWTFNSGGPGSGIYVSHDAGETWTKRTASDGLPEGDLGRIGLAIAPSRPNIVYALVEAKENALYKSTDGARTFRKISTDENIGNRPFYYHDIFVDPQNENRVYSLFSLVTRSEDGGKSWEVLLPYSHVHPDHHAWWIHPDDPDFIIDGNDGGLYITRDGGKSWRFAENLPVGQFYHVNHDMSIPYRIGGGMQDNGSWVGPAYAWQDGGIRNSHWQEVFFGDGFDLAFRPDSRRYVYAMSQGGNLGYIDLETGRSKFARPVHPDGIELRFNWNAAFAQDPAEPCTIYYGSQFVHKSTDCGDSWAVISPDLTTNDPAKQQQDKSGGLTIDNTAAENHTTILAIAPSPVDRNILWVGTDDGNLQITRDGGQSWTNVAANLPGVRAGSWIPYIEVSKRNRGEAFVVVNDYRRNDWRPMVFHTTDFGATFRRIVDEKQASGPALCIIQDPVEPNLFFLGTDHGLYFSTDGAQSWTKWTNGYPSVPTIDLKIHPRENDLIIATFGRSFWIFDDIRPFRELARSSGNILAGDFRVFPAPDAYLAEYKSYAGTRFAADGIYQGENRPEGARLTAWIKPIADNDASMAAADHGGPAGGKDGYFKADTKDAKKGKRPEKIKVQVIDQAGDTIRTFTTKADTGFVRFSWNMRRDGVRFPSRREARPDADPPSGHAVLPGTYKLLMTYGDFKDSTDLTVYADPRLEVNLADLRARDAVYSEFNGLVEKATAGFENLQAARKTIKRVDEALANAPDSSRQAIAKMGKALQDSIASLEKLYMEPEGLKGIQRSNDDLNSALSGVSRYLRSLEGPANQPVKVAMKKAREETAKVLEEVNAFMTTDFAKYRQAVEAVKFSLFGDFEAVKME